MVGASVVSSNEVIGINTSGSKFLFKTVGFAMIPLIPTVLGRPKTMKFSITLPEDTLSPFLNANIVGAPPDLFTSYPNTSCVTM